MDIPDPSLTERLQTAMAPKEKQVLVAEDDPVSAKILATLLTREGYEPLIARSGDAAWELFNQTPVRLVVSDWMMSGMDGLGLCAHIRKRAKTSYTYFILLTANHTSAENYALATAAGVDDFLTKPLDREILRMRLKVAERILRFTAEIRQLKELIPICVFCRKVRDEGDYWERVETYIQNETGSRFSHGACPECTEKEIASFRQESGLEPTE